MPCLHENLSVLHMNGIRYSFPSVGVFLGEHDRSVQPLSTIQPDESTLCNDQADAMLSTITIMLHDSIAGEIAFYASIACHRLHHHTVTN